MTQESLRDEAAKICPILARHAALLDGLITAEEAAALLSPDLKVAKPEKATA